MSTTLTTHTTRITDDIGREIDAFASYHGPQMVVIKRLGWRRLADAGTEHAKSGIGYVNALGGAAVVKEIQSLAADTNVRKLVAEAKQADPLVGYDQASLALWGTVTLDGEPVTQGAINDLEPDVLERVARAVLRLARPGLFETEADEKNA
jgi:hypothetical protein